MIRAFVDSARRETAFLRGSVWDLALVTWLPLLLLAIVAVQLSASVMRNLPIVVVDEQAVVLEWNEAATRVFQYPRDQAVGRRIDEANPIVAARLSDGPRSRPNIRRSARTSCGRWVRSS